MVSSNVKALMLREAKIASLSANVGSSFEGTLAETKLKHFELVLIIAGFHARYGDYVFLIFVSKKKSKQYLRE